MAIEINGKVYRNLQEQVEENLDDITEIKEDLLVDEAAITSLQTGKANVSDVYNKTAIDGIVEDLEEDIAAKASISDLATVATTGSYSDLTNKPDLSVYQLAADAFSGDYDDLTNKPSIPSSTDFVTITGSQTITGVKSFQNTDGAVHVYPSGFVNVSKASTGRSVTVKPDMLECSGNAGSTPADFKIINYYSGGSSAYTFDRTKSGTVAVTTDIPSTALNLYQHKYKFDYSDSVDGVYFKFEVAFISSRSTVYTTIADIFTYLLAHNNNGDIVGRVYGYTTILPTDWVFGGEIEADVTMDALQFTVRDDTHQPATYEVYDNSVTLDASSCHLIN